MKKNVCRVIGAGEYFGLDAWPAPGDFLIAADGGYRYCQQEGLTPDLLLGDFDSLGEVPDFENVLRVPVEKDDTDTMLALRVGLERGYRIFHIYGGTGGRLDHTLANLQALVFLAKRGAAGYLHDNGFVYTAVTDGALTITGEKGHILSAFAFDGIARGVRIVGAQYPLSGAELTPDVPLGVSNHFVEQSVEIGVERGTLLVGWQVNNKNTGENT